MKTFEEKQQVNERLKKIELHKDKFYVEVSERLKGFWELYPNGKVESDLIEQNETHVVMKTSLYDGVVFLSNGYAEEKITKSGVNFTSALENCETSSLGRALGKLGIGLIGGIASYDEVKKAEENAAITATKEQVEYLVANANDLIEEFKKRNIKTKSDIQNLSIEEATELVKISKRD